MKPGIDSGRVALVTGGASGIGRAVVKRFLRAGMSVAAVDIDESAEESLLAESGRIGCGSLAFWRTDVGSEDEIRAAVERVGRDFGRLDVMVNNVGLSTPAVPIARISSEIWDRIFTITCRSVFLGTKYAADSMVANGGSVINTASIAGLSGGCGSAPYSSAKAAVVNFTKTVAAELFQRGIRINCICPGPIDTPFLRSRSPASGGASGWPPLGLAEDVAEAALFLSGDESRFITGTSIVVDGGITAQGPDRTGRTFG